MEEKQKENQLKDKKESIKRAKFRKKKSSSSSSIFLDTTMLSPSSKDMIKAVAILLKTQINEDNTMIKTISKESDLYYFSEEKYIEEFPEYFDEKKKANIHKSPTIDEISEFMEALYNCVQFSPECCIICLIYIYRIIAITGLSLKETNWRPLVFTSLMICQKIWDDNSLPNGDFTIIYPFFDKDQLNKLEMKFMEIIQYNLNINTNQYSNFYFNLKDLAKKENINIKPLSIYDLEKIRNQIDQRKEKLSKRSDSHGKRLKIGENSNYVIN